MVLRFTYFTDVAVNRPGWFIDDLRLTDGGGSTLYENNFESEESAAQTDVVNGGCTDDRRTGPCTDGWQCVMAGQESTADHAYYLELRDRTGFDFDSRGQADRAPGMPDWLPGVSLGYTDEFRGYGNVTEFYRPNQHILDDDRVPFGEGTVAESLTPELETAAWTLESVPFDDSLEGHADNYVEFTEDGAPIPWVLAFNCLQLDVQAMTGSDVGPSGPPGNLRANVLLSRLPGCTDRDYGLGGADNQAPTAEIQATPTTALVGQTVTFDASGSVDDVTPLAELDFAWDFGDGTTATGDQATHAYSAPGDYTVTLSVTDEGGAQSTATIVISVAAAGPDGPGPGPRPTPPRPPPTEPPPTEPPPTEPPPTEPPAGGDNGNAVDRLAGADRIETAVQLWQAGFDTAATAVLATAGDFPDALAASALAGEVNGPILLTGADGLDVRVALELVRLGTTTAYLAGGEAVLSDQVVADLATLGIAVIRVADGERNATAVAIANEVVALGGAVQDVIVARNDDYPDALGAGNVATWGQMPILLTEVNDMPDATADAIEALVPEGGEVLIVGGTAAVSEDVEAAINGLGISTRRIAGANRLETGLALVAEALDRGADLEPTILASAGNYPTPWRPCPRPSSWAAW